MNLSHEQVKYIHHVIATEADNIPMSIFDGARKEITALVESGALKRYFQKEADRPANARGTVSPFRDASSGQINQFIAALERGAG